jgi:hypothetical protein
MKLPKQGVFLFILDFKNPENPPKSLLFNLLDKNRVQKSKLITNFSTLAPQFEVLPISQNNLILCLQRRFNYFN